ncbi:MetQ/NlpA family ABC transporter substrate-binding protein [Microvirga sp. VF16]|uniref:MetQ/NlpA family ABC transporter substrate-binding protein n=1 Tax=Microvirga sp. VF16 TaxID=2807101 RepID=UPI00193E6619|nr:MetQ/NlpA family ABC transporter substrate-binding protein [Microvirga sp. VF16]QRM30940.1 MetQ/NlpA family ABC transporter substrate-binding protein [Microvirga sp. VF16]
MLMKSLTIWHRRRSNTKFFPVLALLAASTWAITSGSAQAVDPLRVGINSGLSADAVHQAAKEAKEQGLDVKVIEFTDWVTPNAALANKDIDVNYFQHIPFLEDAKKARGYDFVSIGVGTMSKVGLYSKKYKSVADLPNGAKVSIANDPVNGGRGLVLLDRIGLIKLKEGLDYKATVADIVSNPKNIKITELVAQQLPTALDDVDLGQGYPAALKQYGVDPNSALIFDDVQKRFAIQWVVRPADAKDPRINKFVAIYQNSPEVKAILKKHFGDMTVPAWEPVQASATNPTN